MDAVLRALAEPHRRQILALVRDQELPAGTISDRFSITRPAVSQHLTVLKQAGLVVERRDGTRRLYRARLDTLAGLRVLLDDFWSRRLSGLKRQAETAHQERAELISVERDITIAQRREVVWQLLTEPDKATRWMGQKASFELRVGGRYQVEVVPGLVAAGEFLEIDPPRRLVHTWGWQLGDDAPVPPGSTVVVYELFDAGDGTRLRLSHRDLPSLATAGSHSRGWSHYLPRLAIAASGRVAGPDPWALDPGRMQKELAPASNVPRARRRKGKAR